MSDVIKVTQIDDKPHVLVRSGISISLYSPVPIPKIGPTVVEAINHYISFIPPDSLKFFFAADGTYKALTKSRITRDLRNLQKLQHKTDFFPMEYSQGHDGEVGSNAVFFKGTRLSDSKYIPLETNLLRLEFPFDLLEHVEMEQFIEFAIRIFRTVPFESGNVGYCLKRASLYKRETTRELNQLLPRYIGFDPSYDNSRNKMRGRIFGAHWINFLSEGLVKEIGGHDAIAKALPMADIRPVDSGILVRNAKSPPIGDVNRGAKDIGCMPDFARLTQSVRAEISGFGEPAEFFDSLEWLARFDEMQSRDWDNS